MNIKLETKYGEPSPEALALPFTPLLPTSEADLLRLRIYVRERCVHDFVFRDEICQMCEADLPFFVMMFGYMHETRGTEDQFGEFPALLDPDQVDILAAWQKYVGKEDVTNEKTRGVGFSYLACFLLMWLWKFNRFSIDMGVLSKDEFALDKRDKPGTFMGKLDLIFKRLPAWMQKTGKSVTVGKKVYKNRSILSRSASNQNHLFKNLENGNTITGYVPTNDKLRSDRLFVLIADEGAFLPIEDQKWLASAHGTCPSVFWISTHQGTANLFYRMTHNEEARLVRISAWWWNNRRWRRGMYRIDHGQVEILDKDYKFPLDYFEQPFIHKLETHIQGRLRSPKVDRQFTRAGIDPQTVLEEVYGLSAVASRKLLRPSVPSMIRRTKRAPMAVGRLHNGDWIDDVDGPVSLWFNPARPPQFCTFGVDPALTEATGAYFAAVAVDFKTGEQVLSYRTKDVSADDFPRIITDLARWAGKGGARPTIACESQGPAGNIFLTGAARCKYTALGGDPNKSKVGYGNSDRGASWLVEWGRAIKDGDVIMRDERLADDADGYEFDDKWELIFANKDGHGDLAIAAALAWHEAKDRRLSYIKAQKKAATIDPEEEQLKRRRARKLWSDRFR